MGAFTVRLADWEPDGALILKVRRAVFIVEQRVPEELDVDGSDAESGCRHALALEGDTPIGTARLDSTGRIGRMAVLRSHRRHGVGAALMHLLIDHARERGFTALHLHSQVHANPFYESFGFTPDGDVFTEADIPHVRMVMALKPEERP